MTLPFSRLTKIYEQLEVITSGNKIREILSNFFKKVPKTDIASVAYLTLGVIEAEYKKTDLGLADKMIVRALSKASNKSPEEIRELSRKTGDLGLVAEKIIRKQGQLTVKKVIDTLRKISTTTGTGSQEAKLNLLVGILITASPKEAKYIVRIALRRLRLGIAAATILDSLAIAFKGVKDKTELEAAYEKTSDIGMIAKIAASKKPIKVGVSVGIPIKMMLAQRVKSLVEMQKHIPGKITAEEKYDGERMQIHKSGEEIMIFSRRLENITHQYPDVLASLKKSIRAKECIIEGEVVAVDKKGNLLPFQRLMQRRRKYKIQEYVKKIPVALFLFDLLYLNGKSHIKKPYPARRNALKKIIKSSKITKFARQTTSADINQVQKFFKQCLHRGAEGIIAKSNSKDSIYKAGTRGWFWIKWKKEYAKGITDTFDLVVVGAFAGRGRRAGKYGALLCAVYNKQKDQFETFTKLGAGFTDKTLAELPKILKRYKVTKKPARVVLKKEMKPDVLFNPNLVLEVLGAEITKSPIHSSGFALRFPRFIRFRNDKSPEQATTKKEIIQMSKKK
ncbi:ATP-dependent DNA ligase [Candidatus Woesearchaeota archaeon]|nr:ATP-dependent DNA ligase [Candidatus Woesearchaeota archaeon]